MRLWQYDKWSTLPMWKKTAQEIGSIMEERFFDEIEIVETPADGVTEYGTWTNPVGWDVKQATLEVIEPSNLPDEFRYLCNYLDNPTSLHNFSCPTPPEGTETELVLVEKSTPEELRNLNAHGKIILVSSHGRGTKNSRWLKRFLDPNGILGIVSDEIESNRDINSNQWLNGWTDIPGGWLMRNADSKNNFGFSISKKKADYLRNLLRQGKTVRVRATIDSRYFTNDTLPYITGCVMGSGHEQEEVLALGHVFEYGACNNSTGASIILEAVGTLNELIRSGVLPRPKRSIRVWHGHELYGSLAYATHNLERLRDKTIATINYPGGGSDYDHSSAHLRLLMNPDVCPSYTDAVLTEIAKRYISSFTPSKMFRTSPYSMGADSYYCEPMIGIPSNVVYMGSYPHHNSMDTIDIVDPRTLHDMSVLCAAYLYYIADAGYDDIPVIADLTFNRGIKVILEKANDMHTRLRDINEGVTLGRIISDGSDIITYYTEQQKRALISIKRIISEDKKDDAQKLLKPFIETIEDFGRTRVYLFRSMAREKSHDDLIKMISFTVKETPWDQEAETLIPKRNEIGTLTLDTVPLDKWQEVNSSPRWWSATNWASASYWWCNGKRNLKEIKKLCEFEAGRPISNFDLIRYYNFLEKYGYVEFVK